MPTEAELIQRARALAPELAARAAECETAGAVPRETIDAFVTAGFYRISQPERYGGYGLSPEVLFRVAMEVARVCPSSGWCLCLVGVHNWEPGLLDARVAEDLWGADHSVRYSSSFAPFGIATAVDGGYRLAGRWQWSSGCQHCQWVILGARLEDEPREQIAFLVPGGDYHIVENWQVAGLKGTGSHDIVVEDAFVPAHRVHRLQAPSAGAFGHGIYDLPFLNIFALCLAAVTQGMAEGALEAYTAYLRERVHKYDGIAMAEDPFQRRTLAEVGAGVRANRVRFHNVFRVLEAALATEPVVPIPVQLEQMWETQVLAHHNADLVTRLMRASGGGAQRLGHPMQRYFRDVNAAVAHAFLSLDRGSMQYVRSQLG
jgi:3-hydroxy-9,10-secoandrosta-1,3,5(10)-triene-9,17-dione monooxygenase